MVGFKPYRPDQMGKASAPVMLHGARRCGIGLGKLRRVDLRFQEHAIHAPAPQLDGQHQPAGATADDGSAVNTVDGAWPWRVPACTSAATSAMAANRGLTRKLLGFTAQLLDVLAAPVGDVFALLVPVLEYFLCPTVRAQAREYCGIELRPHHARNTPL